MRPELKVPPVSPVLLQLGTSCALSMRCVLRDEGWGSSGSPQQGAHLLVASCLPEVHSNTVAVGPGGGHVPCLFQILCDCHLPGRKEPMSSGHQRPLNPSPSLVHVNLFPAVICPSSPAGLIPSCPYVLTRQDCFCLYGCTCVLRG